MGSCSFPPILKANNLGPKALIPRNLQPAVAALKKGGIIAYPTEAVYGLGCDPFNEQAVLQLLAIKNRPQHKGLIVIAASIEQLMPHLTHLPKHQLQKLEAAWPGPVSYVVPDVLSFPKWIRGQHQSVVFRVTTHPVAAQLCRAWGGPIVSTSANLAGQPPIREFYQLRLLKPQLDAVVRGKVGERKNPSTIIRLQDDVVLRQG